MLPCGLLRGLQVRQGGGEKGEEGRREEGGKREEGGRG
jgi:hypothetical protein